jgi:hypothetical protein
MRFATMNRLPGIIPDGPKGPVLTTGFEIEGGVLRALHVVRNPKTLRLSRGVGTSRERSRMSKPVVVRVA